MAEWWEIGAAVGVALVGREGIGAWLNAMAQARKAQADAGKVDVEARMTVTSAEWQQMRDIISTLQEENHRLVNRVVALEESDAVRDKEMEGLRLGVVVLISQLRECGIEPRWEPKELGIRN